MSGTLLFAQGDAYYLLEVTAANALLRERIGEDIIWWKLNDKKLIWQRVEEDVALDLVYGNGRR